MARDGSDGNGRRGRFIARRRFSWCGGRVVKRIHHLVCFSEAGQPAASAAATSGKRSSWCPVRANPRESAFFIIEGGRGPLHYILNRPVVLDEIKIRRGDRLERHAQISHDGNRFQENLRQEHGGAPIQKHAAGVHLLRPARRTGENRHCVAAPRATAIRPRMNVREYRCQLPDAR